MIIVVEGPDNSGKSTLALKLVKLLKGMFLKTEFIPPEEISLVQYMRLIDAAKHYGNGIVISDRHAAISDPIYGPIVRGWTKLNRVDVDVAIRQIDAIIYCRPPNEKILKTMGERQQMAGVEKNALRIIQAYDEFFGNFQWTGKLWRYDWTKDSPEMIAKEIQRFT